MSVPAYLILSTPYAGRRGLCVDVCKNALADMKVRVLVAAQEPPSANEAALGELANVSVSRYASAEDALGQLGALAEGGFDAALFLANSANNLADEVENFKRAVDGGAVRLARVWSIIDCKLNLEFAKRAAPYFEALSHFADCVMFSQRGGVPNASVLELQDRFARQCKPHLMVLMDKFCRVANPMELVVEQARRISMLFDEFDPADELELDGDNLPDEPFSLERKPDPYLERLPAGVRKNPLPNLAAQAMQIHKNED